MKTELNGTSFYGNTSYIDEISKGYIANGIWYIGGVSSPYTLENFEALERNLSSTGYVGLMGVTDFGYASDNIGCERTTIDLSSSNNACMSNNYLFNNSMDQWTITSHASFGDHVWYVCGGISTSFLRM